MTWSPARVRMVPKLTGIAADQCVVWGLLPENESSLEGCSGFQGRLKHSGSPEKNQRQGRRLCLKSASHGIVKTQVQILRTRVKVDTWQHLQSQGPCAETGGRD